MHTYPCFAVRQQRKKLSSPREWCLRARWAGRSPFIGGRRDFRALRDKKKFLSLVADGRHRECSYNRGETYIQRHTRTFVHVALVHYRFRRIFTWINKQPISGRTYGGGGGVDGRIPVAVTAMECQARRRVSQRRKAACYSCYKLRTTSRSHAMYTTTLFVFLCLYTRFMKVLR